VRMRSLQIRREVFTRGLPLGTPVPVFSCSAASKVDFLEKRTSEPSVNDPSFLKHTMLRPTASLHAFDCSGAAIECDLNAVPEFYQK
jgi:hypothetical protein